MSVIAILRQLTGFSPESARPASTFENILARSVPHDQRDNKYPEQGKQHDGDGHDGKDNTHPAAISSNCSNEAYDGN
jgi:hypothetical protein